MSEQNEEVARSAIEAYNQDGVDGLDAFWHVDIEYHDLAELPDAGVHHGLEAGKNALQSALDLVGGHVAIHPEDLRVAGDEVMYGWRFKAKGTASDVPLDATFFHVAIIRNGKVVRLRQFLDRDMALEAAGLRK